MKRRRFLGVLSAAGLLPWRADAQEARRLPHVGFLGNSTAALEANLVAPFREALADLGYTEGRNIVIDYRWADGDYARLPGLVNELIALKVDVIVTAGTPAAMAVGKATSTVPLVMVAVGDPVGTGLVSSLAHPGGNATGLTSIAPELEGKRLELLKEVLPRLSRIAVLWNPVNAYQLESRKEVEAAASVLALSPRFVAVSGSEELDAALKGTRTDRVDAIVVLADRLFLHHRERIADFCIANRLPGMNAYRELVDAGGLMSFGPSYAVMHRQAASYVDKILRGARAGDLPIEQPAKFELVINLKTAALLGLAFPPSVQLRADAIVR